MIRRCGHPGYLVLLMLAAGCSSLPVRGGEDVRVVEADGWTPLDPKDRPATRRRAIADAQKNAVEQASGVTLAASTRIDGAIAVRQRVDARTLGFIREFDLLSESLEGGLYKTRIRAVVVRANDADSDVASVPTPDSVELRIQIDGFGPGAARWGLLAGSVIGEGLSARGFVIEHGQVSDGHSILSVLGRVRTFQVANRNLAGFRSYRAVLRIEVRDPSRGVILSRSHESAAVAIDSESAAAAAVHSAGTIAAAALSEDMTTYLWRRP